MPYWAYRDCVSFKNAKDFSTAKNMASTRKNVFPVSSIFLRISKLLHYFRFPICVRRHRPAYLTKSHRPGIIKKLWVLCSNKKSKIIRRTSLADQYVNVVVHERLSYGILPGNATSERWGISPKPASEAIKKKLAQMLKIGCLFIMFFVRWKNWKIFSNVLFALE